MSNPFILNTDEQTREMLAKVGASSIDDLFREQVPEQFLVADTGLPEGCTEIDIQRDLSATALAGSASLQKVSFLGGGIYDHFVPSAVGALANRSEFVTAYTPYQPEASQGTLQAFFEFQTMISRLFEMDVANASLYDGASALGESLFLALNAKPDRTRIVLPATLHPDYRAVVETYLAHFGIDLVTAPERDGVTDCEQLAKLVNSKTAAVVLQHPNYFGCLEDVSAISGIAHENGALLVAVVDPMSLGLLAPPGSYGADIAVGEGQSLGLRPWLGGETVGLFTCKTEHIRRVPGRLVGLTQDRENRRGYVLTLQTREQHIRRAKATSNICTNHAHNALRATIFLSLMGPQGMARVARACVRGTKRLHAKLPAHAIAYTAPVFKEFVIKCKTSAEEVLAAMLDKGYFAGVPVGDDRLLVCVTEKRTDAEIDAFASALEEYL